MKQYNSLPTGGNENLSLIALETKLWENVQKAYAASRHYRAGDNPEYAKALAAFDRAANPPRASNVIQLRGRE